MIRVLIWLLVGSALGLGVSRGDAQVVRGEFVDGATGAGIPGAVIVLLDPQGEPAASTLTDERGTFTLQTPRGGQYRLRAERIGYKLTSSPAFPLDAGQTLTHRLVSAAERIALQGIVVEAGTPRCTVRPKDGAQTAVVWEEASKALRATETAQEQQLFRYGIRRFERHLEPSSSRVVHSADQHSTRYIERPFHSVPARQLARVGFIENAGDTVLYHAPGAEVLLSDAFLDQHCFRLQPAPKGEPDLIGLAFEPVRSRRLPDIQGVLWLDHASSELRALDYSYTNPPVRVHDGVPGGRVEFRRLPNGITYISEWTVRMPVRARRSLERSGVPGAKKESELLIREEGGVVTSVTTTGGTLVSMEPEAVLTGVVYDSTQAGPLAGAEVFLSGTSYRVETDSAGRYRFQGMQPGSYSLGVSAPRLVALGYYPPLASVALRKGEMHRHDVSIPSLGVVLSAACEKDTNGSVVAGFARNALTGEPAVGARIRISWPGANLREEHLQTQTDENGIYRLCGVPAQVPLTLAANAENGSEQARLNATAGMPVLHNIAFVPRGSVATEEPRATASRGGKPDRNRLTREEIATSGQSDVLSAVQHLRPQWLRKRGGARLQTTMEKTVYGEQHTIAQSEIAAYRDGVVLPGGLNELRMIPVESIEIVEYIDASTATTRWGVGHEHGAILVTSRRG